MDDAMVYFLGQWPAEGAAAATVRTYGRQLAWLVRFAADRGRVWLADLTPELLRSAMAEKLAPSSGPNHKGGESAAHSLCFAARRMASWLAQQGVPVADLSTVRARRPPERIQPRLHPAEFAALENSVLHRLVEARARAPRMAIARDLALLYMLANTGLRAAEVCGMLVRSVDFQLGAVLVVRGKGNKERALSIVDPDDPRGGITLQLLADWIDARSTLSGAARHNLLWTSTRGRPLSPDGLRLVLARVCRDAGLAENRPPHTFRRANFTESYLAQPAAIKVLASRMGWSPRSTQMIDVYTRGVEIDFARTTPMPAVTTRWRNASPNVPVALRAHLPILRNGVGPPSGGTLNNPALPNQRRTDRNRAASQPPTKGDRRLPG